MASYVKRRRARVGRGARLALVAAVCVVMAVRGGILYRGGAAGTDIFFLLLPHQALNWDSWAAPDDSIDGSAPRRALSSMSACKASRRRSPHFCGNISPV